MTAPDVTRRGLLGAGAGLGAMAVTGAESTATAQAAHRPPEHGSRYRPVSMAMHTHACFSEGGSYATGGGGASMMSQLDQATRSGVDVLWWTDHDWRMQAYGYYEGIAFDGTEEDGDLTWTVQNAGDPAAVSHTFVSDPHSPAEPGQALRVSADGVGDEWSTSLSWAKAGNSFYSTNISDTTLTIDVLADEVGPDAELVVQLETSYRPATAGRPAGVYVLEYRVGDRSSRALDGPLTGAVTVRSSGGWQTLTLHPLQDVRRFWPDLVAEDSGLARLRFGVRVRRGATATAVFDHLRILRTRDPQRWPVRTQRDLMRRLRGRYPHVTQLLSAEVSMIRHMNAFMEDFELYPYPPTAKAPVLDNSVEAAERVVRWYHERGALMQYNHPPIDAAELVATRALGTDLIEVANANGDFTVIHDRIDLYDVAARNAIFLTATSQIDDHAGRDWVGKEHLYLTSVWAQSTQAGHLIDALGAGRAWWHHQARWPDGRLDLLVDDRPAMGQVLRSRRSSVTIGVSAEGLAHGATVAVVTGVCDRTGATTPAVQRSTHDAATLRRSRLSVDVTVGPGAYVRVETHDREGVLIGFSNPVWVLPHDADVTVPRSRRLATRDR